MPRNARPWFRIFSEALDSRKLQRLKPPLKWTWFNLMCLANITRPRGALPDLIEIAYRLRTTERLAEVDLRDLKAAGLIDDKDGVLFMHDWDEWQKESDVRASSVPDSGPVAAPLRPGSADIPQRKRRNSVPLEKSREERDPDPEKEKSRTRASLGWPEEGDDGPESFRQTYRREFEKTGNPISGNRMLIAGQLERQYGSQLCIDVAEAHGWDKHPNYYKGPLEDLSNGATGNTRNGTSTAKRPAAEHLGEPGPEPPKRIFLDRFTGEPI